MLIRFDSVSRTFGDVVAIDDLTLSVAAGEVIALCGPNGAGKSTLLHLAIGLLAPTVGTVRVMGENPNRDWLVKRSIGYAGDLSDLIGELTIEELLYYTGSLRGSRLSIDAEIDGLISAFQLASKRHEWIRNLSEGMRRKVSILQALVGAPPLLILDEPTSGLDIETQQLCRQVLAVRAERGTTILLGTHDFRLLDVLRPRLIFLDAGRKMVDDHLAELFRSHGCGRAEDLILELWPNRSVAMAGPS